VFLLKHCVVVVVVDTLSEAPLTQSMSIFATSESTNAAPCARSEPHELPSTSQPTQRTTKQVQIQLHHSDPTSSTPVELTQAPGRNTRAQVTRRLTRKQRRALSRGPQITSYDTLPSQNAQHFTSSGQLEPDDNLSDSRKLECDAVTN